MVAVEKKEFEFSNDELKNIYLQIKNSLDNSDIEIVAIEHLNYVERYSFKKGDEVARVDFIYNKNYQITKMNNLNGGSEVLFNEILDKIE